jgi:hypothetical protein
MKLLHNVPLHKIKAGIGFGYLALPVFKKRAEKGQIGYFCIF